MPTPWVEDAREFEVSSDLSPSSLLQTDGIRDFLSKNNSARTVVLAPKGCGKTLLIKYKRKNLERTGIKLLPENKLVDVAPAYAPPFEESQIQHIRKEPQFWSTLWQISLTMAVVKSLGTPDPARFKAPIKNLMENPDLRDPFQIFAELLRATPKLFFAAFEDFTSHLLPAYSLIHQPTAIFIDNIDEYFSHHLLKQKHHGLFGQLAEDFWFDSQIGLLMAIRQLFSHNPHIKTYAAIRSEAYNARKSALPDLANLRSHIFRIELGYEELKSIFEGNIRFEKKSRMVTKTAEDPFEQMFGRENLYLRHIYTGRKEFIFDYIIRHTLWRPRDLMTVGFSLSSIPPERRTSQTIRETINDAAAEIAESYLGESSPHLTWFDQHTLFRDIDRNVLRRDELAEISKAYDLAEKEDSRFAENTTGDQAFADLHQCGLIGVVSDDFYGKSTQKFNSVYNTSISEKRRQPGFGDAELFLVHPVLGSYLKRGDSKFGKMVDSINVIAPNSPWLVYDDMRYVLQADLCGYSNIIKDPAIKEAFPHIFKKILQSSRDGIEYFEMVGGDGFAFADRNGYLLVRAAHQIAHAVKQSLFHADLRFGMDYGVVRLNHHGNQGFSPDICVQRSARLQRASAPGHILMLPHVRESLETYDVDWPFAEVETNDVRFSAKPADGQWQIGKKEENFTSEVLIGLSLFDFSL